MDETEEGLEGFSERLKRRRKALGLTQKQLADAVGISAKTIQKFEYGDIPKGPNLLRLSRALNCSIDWLLLGSGAGGVDPDQDEGCPHGSHGELSFVPRVLARLDTNGEFLEKNQNSKSEYAFRLDWLRQVGNPSDMILLEVSGDSMSPEIKDGDSILIDRGQREIYVGKIYAVRMGRDILVRYVDRAPEKILFRSANRSFGDIVIDIEADAREPIGILGRVVWWCRDVG